MVTAALLFCPGCGAQHIDLGKWARFDHKRHLCYACGRFFEAEAPNVGVVTLAATQDSRETRETRENVR